MCRYGEVGLRHRWMSFMDVWDLMKVRISRSHIAFRVTWSSAITVAMTLKGRTGSDDNLTALAAEVVLLGPARIIQ